jgi:hypothetical protein
MTPPKRVPPPPTRFGPRPVQASPRPVGGRTLAVYVPPPPTRFGPRPIQASTRPMAGRALVAQRAASPASASISVSAAVSAPVDLNDVTLLIGGRPYRARRRSPANSGEKYIVVPLPTGKLLWVHEKKSVLETGTPRELKLTPAEDGLAQQYLTGALHLYRGMLATHVVAADGWRGILSAKPTANSDEPEFTSETSTTRFIPFTSDRNIAVMAGKSGYSGPPIDELAHNTAIGMVIEVTVGPNNSLCMFDAGEIQVLAPPQGTATAIVRGTHISGRRIDGLPDLTALDQGRFSYIGHVLKDARWADEGAGFFSSKVPDGIAEMRQAYDRGRIWDVFAIATRKHGQASQNRSTKTRTLYEYLAKMDNAKSKKGGDDFRQMLRGIAQWNPLD